MTLNLYHSALSHRGVVASIIIPMKYQLPSSHTLLAKKESNKYKASSSLIHIITYAVVDLKTCSFYNFTIAIYLNSNHWHQPSFLFKRQVQWWHPSYANNIIYTIPPLFNAESFGIPFLCHCLWTAHSSWKSPQPFLSLPLTDPSKATNTIVGHLILHHIDLPQNPFKRAWSSELTTEKDHGQLLEFKRRCKRKEQIEKREREREKRERMENVKEKRRK